MRLDREGILNSMSSILGDQIRRTRVMRLGNPLTGEVKVSLDDADAPGRVYVHGIGGENLANPGDDSENKQTVSQAVLPPGAIGDDYLIYGTAVEVVRKNGVQRVVQFEPIGANEYLYRVKIRPQRSIDISQIDYGLLRPTDTLSMHVLVTGARYMIGGQVYDVPTRQSDSFSAYKPATAGLAVAVKIEIDPITATLYYEAGAEFDSSLSHAAAFGDYPVSVAEDRFFCGWVKVKASQTSINIADIYHAPELLNKAPSLTSGVINYIRLQEQGSAPPTPAATFRVIYATSDGLFVIDSAGNILGPLHGGNVIAVEEISTPATPDAGQRKLYAKPTGWYDLDDMGVETLLGSGGGIAFRGVKLKTDTTAFSGGANVIFTSEDIDTDDYANLGTNADRFTIPTDLDGLYRVNFTGTFLDFDTTSQAGWITFTITHHDPSDVAFLYSVYVDFAAGAQAPGFSIELLLDMAATDYVFVDVAPNFSMTGDLYVFGYLTAQLVG